MGFLRVFSFAWGRGLGRNWSVRFLEAPRPPTLWREGEYLLSAKAPKAQADCQKAQVFPLFGVI